MSSSDLLKSEGIVVVSCSTKPPQDIILQILGKENLPDAVSYSDIKGYYWSFETKYYIADVYLYALKEKKELDAKFSKTIKSIIIYFDGTKSSSLEDIKSWMPHLENIDAEVQLLICNESVDESDGRKNIMNWCVQNQYELVELNSASESDDEDECRIKDAKGYARVIQSLQSHVWANLVMKDEKTKKSKEMKQDTSSKDIPGKSLSTEASCQKIATEPSACKSEPMKNSKKVKVENEELELEEQLLSNVLSGDDPGGESFEALFSKFASMKDRAAGLNGEERRKYAEKVAIEFWRAMGGDEDEIEGLDD